MTKKDYLKILASLFVFAIIIAGSLSNFPIFNKVANALNVSDYNKPTTGGQLTVDDWNRLDEDFLARNGGNSMAVNLDMGNNRITNLAAPQNDNEAVTRGAMNTAISNAVSGITNITDTGGNSLKMVCGVTGTTWTNDTMAANTVYQVVDISPYNFATTPQIFTSLIGSNYLYLAMGTNSIYWPSSNSFTIFVTHHTQVVNSTNAQNWNWRINWCAVGR